MLGSSNRGQNTLADASSTSMQLTPRTGARAGIQQHRWPDGMRTKRLCVRQKSESHVSGLLRRTRQSKQSTGFFHSEFAIAIGSCQMTWCFLKPPICCDPPTLGHTE